MLRGLTFMLVLILSGIACQPIVVRVGERQTTTELSGPGHSVRTEADAVPTERWNSVEEFLQNLDDIKKLGREALIKRYHQDGRMQIREVFRHFRDAVESKAAEDPGQVSPYWNALQLGACVPVRVRDVFELEPYGDLRTLLETAFLNKIKPSEVIPDPSVPNEMDDVTKLGFFELGIAMDGQSYLTNTGDAEAQGSDLRWKVIHEQNEPESWAALDERGVQLRFRRSSEASKRVSFELDARVGPEVYEQNAAGSLPSLVMDYKKRNGAEGQSEQELLMLTGYRDAAGAWQSRQVSRKIVVTQNIARGHILHIAVTENFQKPSEKTEQFLLDMDSHRLCSSLGSL